MGKDRIAGAILSFAGLALAGEFVVRAFDWGWHLLVGDGPLTFATSKNIVGIIALGFGLYLFFRPATDKAGERRRALIENMAILRRRLGTNHDRDVRLFGEIASVYYGLDKLGIMTPSQADGANPQSYEVALAFVSNILPMIRDGHIKEAREQAPAIITALGVTPSRFKVPIYKRIWPFNRSIAQVSA